MKQEFGASGPDNAAWKGDDVTYRTVHARLAQSRGKASEYPCVTCGRPAQQWSYDHRDEPKLTAVQGRVIPYSTNLDRYEPMCHGCHVKRDRGEYGNGWARKTRCKRNHPFDESNTYVLLSGKRAGERRCRACARDYMRERRLRKVLS